MQLLIVFLNLFGILFEQEEEDAYVVMRPAEAEQRYIYEQYGGKSATEVHYENELVREMAMEAEAKRRQAWEEVEAQVSETRCDF